MHKCWIYVSLKINICFYLVQQTSAVLMEKHPAWGSKYVLEISCIY